MFGLTFQTIVPDVFAVFALNKNIFQNKNCNKVYFKINDISLPFLLLLTVKKSKSKEFLVNQFLIRRR